jgi:hypothetical protein
MTTPEPPPKEPLDDEDDEKTRTVADGSPARWARERSFNRTAPCPLDVASDRTFRVALLGFSLCSDRLPGVLDHMYERAFADHPGPRIALHAGVAYGPEPWPTGTDEVHRAAAAHEVTALFEARLAAGTRAYEAYAPGHGLLPIEIHQRFVNSAQADADPGMVAELVADCGPGRERTVNLGGLCLGLLVCGENNVLTNQQGNANRVLVRHDENAHLFEEVRVVFNGGHSTMGNWGKMDERFKYLSRERRWAFYATNCGNNGWGRSTVRAYHDGVLIADSLGPRAAPPAGVPEPRLVYDDVDDRCLALVLDIPGRMLA